MARSPMRWGGIFWALVCINLSFNYCICDVHADVPDLQCWQSGWCPSSLCAAELHQPRSRSAQSLCRGGQTFLRGKALTKKLPLRTMWSVCTCLDFGLLNLYCLSLTLSLPPDRKTIFFNSHQVSKPESSSDLTAVSTDLENSNESFTYKAYEDLTWCDFLISPPPKLDEQMPYLPPPSSAAVAALVKELRSQLGMALFGVDVIINIHTHTLTVIDINIFPGSTFMWTHKLSTHQWSIHPFFIRLWRCASVFLLPAPSHQVCVEEAELCLPSACWASRTLADRSSICCINGCLRHIRGCCVIHRLPRTNGVTSAGCWDKKQLLVPNGS